MSRRLFLRCVLFIVFAGMLITFGLQYYASRMAHESVSGNPMVIGSKLAVFMIWGVLPYLSLMVPIFVVNFPNSAFSTYLMAVVLIVGLALYEYVRHIFIMPEPGAYIIFFTMPLCQLFGVSVAYGCVWLFHRKSHWKEKKPIL